MRSGFTLVELSIVLVIIGLLIGGILVGQSLISSAEINRGVRDLAQYEIATKQFYSRFRQVPGDAQYFTPPGNDDGILGDGANGNNPCSASPNTNLSNEEIHQFWAHLSESKMLSSNYVPYSPTNNCGGVHLNYQGQGNRDVVWPEIMPVSFNTSTSVVKVSPQSNIILIFSLDAEDLLAFENKLSGVDFVNASTQEGLVNIGGRGNCWDTALFSYQKCFSSENARFGTLYYLVSED